MKQIPKFHDYAADEDGVIYSKALRGRQTVARWRALRPCTKPNGYLTVSVRWPDGVHRHAYVHRLVLMAFTGEPSHGQQTRHINGIRSDNRPCNLCWGSQAENEEDKGGKLSILDRLTARAMRKTGATTQHIASTLGVSRPTISRLLSGKTWK